MVTNTNIGKIAYDAYREAKRYTDTNGEYIEHWDSLDDDTRDAWTEAAYAVARVANPAWYGGSQ